MSNVARQSNLSRPPAETWLLILNRYQRDNLLQLLNLIGVNSLPFDAEQTTTEPFNIMNNGDWPFEIGWMLAKDTPGYSLGSATIDGDDHPNESLDTIREKVRQWKNSLGPDGG